jgi:DNA repair protein RadA/Sms
MIIREPAADLAVCSALISSYKNISPRPNSVIMGEVGLTGEIRPIGFMETRLKESIRQGFLTLCLPAAQSSIQINQGISVFSAKNIHDLLDFMKK